MGDHYVQAYYLGWTGDGHIGWLNIDHAFYQVLGEDSLNGIAGQRININAQMAALELSVDKNWLRHKLSFFYASGDDDPTDSHATGFDTVMDRPFFIGGPFSFYSTRVSISAARRSTLSSATVWWSISAPAKSKARPTS